MYLEQAMNSWSLLASRTQTKQKSVHQKVFIDPLKMYGPRWRPKRAAAIGAKHKSVKYGPYFGWHFPQFLWEFTSKYLQGTYYIRCAKKFLEEKLDPLPRLPDLTSKGPQLDLHLMDWRVHLRSCFVTTVLPDAQKKRERTMCRDCTVDVGAGKYFLFWTKIIW